MYAIVEIAGQQFKVAKDQKVYVHRLQGEEGSKVTFDNVLLVEEKGNVTIGAPAIEGAAVTAKILSHLKGDKVIVFKKKRRKGYKKKNGHRQYLSEIQIESVAVSGAKKVAPKKEEVKAETPKVATKNTTSKKEDAKVDAPKATTKKTTSKKEDAKVDAPKAATKKTTPKKEDAKVDTPKTEAKKATPKKVAKADDLKKIEGIGPKISETLVAAGIVTFADLAKTKSAKISEIIAGVRGNHVTDTWPKQAKLAAAGKWEELKTLQDILDGGVEK